MSHNDQPLETQSMEAKPRSSAGEGGEEEHRITPPLVEKPGKGRRRWMVLVLLLLLFLVGGVMGYEWWQYSLVHESTDNAYVQGPMTLVSARVPGTVIDVLVEENQPVREGDLLVRLDPADYQVAVEQAEAAAAVIRSRLEATRLSVPYSRDQTSALIREANARLARLQKTLEATRAGLLRQEKEVEAAAANLEKADKDLRRAQTLYRQHLIPRAELDNALTAKKVAEANYAAAEAARQMEEEKVAALERQRREVQAQIALARTGNLSTQMRVFDSESVQADLKQAQANLKRARLLLSYTEIRAPIAGYVSQKNVEIGNYVEPGRPLLAIIPLDEVWVEANFKEVQLEEIRIGQPAIIEADAYPGYRYRGHVESISAGTGDAFSLLPPENATGNWVKVTRRVPVKIVLDQPPPPEYPLRIGMSTTVTIDTSDRSGPRLLAYPSLPPRTGKTVWR
ncbi:MAG: HlyD family secretion protein [Nitrospinota bacterium]|nr:MAG: HlyD family secretion protein [Nitrospinota bacterium]